MKFSIDTTLNCKGKLIDFNTPKIMGILNITPDSFYDGGKNNSIEKAILKCNEMVENGVDFIDIGGYSSRPGASEISEQEEMDRILPVIEKIVDNFPELPISIDSFRSKVAKEAILAGASIINDISGGELDHEMFATVAQLQVPYIMMHMRGNPVTMQNHTNYTDLIQEIAFYFSEKINHLTEMGVNDILLDPGIGFSKTVNQNFEILNKLSLFSFLQKPLLVGLSRKSMIYKTLNTSPTEALNGTTAMHMVALQNGANILRVHDVKEANEVRTLFLKLEETG